VAVGLNLELSNYWDIMQYT